MSSRTGPAFQTSREQRDELARRFFAAAERGDLAGLESLLAAGVQLSGDRGGKTPALAQAQSRRPHSAGLAEPGDPPHRHRAAPGRSSTAGPGVLVFDSQERLVGVTALEIADGEVKAVRSIANPDKLSHLGPVGNLGWVIDASR